jgi:hypothetical protein
MSFLRNDGVFYVGAAALSFIYCSDPAVKFEVQPRAERFCIYRRFK